MKTSARYESEAADGVYSSEWRHEIKFPVSEPRARELAATLAPLLRADAHSANDGCYLVKTLYFDTPHFDDFDDKERGASMRQKVRLRSYGEGGVWRLELKIKLDDLNLKRSCELDEASARALARGDIEAVRNARGGDAEYLRAFMLSRGYRPRAVIKYSRRALRGANDGFRLTIDRGMTYSTDPASLFSAKSARDIPLDGAVVEVKYNDFLPMWIVRELNRRGVSGGEFSKYSLGCAAAFGYIL